jgi:uncharacterized protein YndB with AHSA1/START domain
MTVADITARSQNEAVAFELVLPHAPTKVWRALTDPTLLSEWLLPVFDHQLAPGAAFTFKTEPQPEWDGVVNCRMIEVDEPRKISWRWVVGDIDTVVTFTLTPAPSGTRLLLVQSGFRPEQKQNFGGARYGWRLMSARLVELLERMA